MITDKLIELTPVVSIDGTLQEEHKDFLIRKYADASVDFFFPKRKLTITVKPAAESSILLIRDNQWPRFYFNGKPVLPQSIFSHIEGHFPGVTIRFIGQEIGMLQLIPRVVDTKYERMDRQKKDWEHYMRKGKFDLDYFEEYGIGTTKNKEIQPEEIQGETEGQ